MLLKDKSGHVALLVSHTNTKVWVVPLDLRGLRVRRLTIDQYTARWQPTVYEITVAISRFNNFAAKYGATTQALKAIEKLKGT